MSEFVAPRESKLLKKEEKLRVIQNSKKENIKKMKIQIVKKKQIKSSLIANVIKWSNMSSLV